MLMMKFELMDPGEAFQLARTQSLLSTRKRKQGGRVNIMNPSTWAEIPNDDFPDSRDNWQQKQQQPLRKKQVGGAKVGLGSWTATISVDDTFNFRSRGDVQWKSEKVSQRKRSGGPITGSWKDMNISREDLDKELDQYMSQASGGLFSKPKGVKRETLGKDKKEDEDEVGKEEEKQ